MPLFKQFRLCRIFILIPMLLAVAFFSIPPALFAQEKKPETGKAELDNDALWSITDEEPTRVRISASTVIAAYYILPTVTEKDDPRRQDNNKIDFNLRNAYIRFRGDIGHGALVRVNLGARRVGELDVNDDGVNDDPDFGQLNIVLDRAELGVVIHRAFNLNLGVIRLPWSWVSEDAWGMGLVANSAPRRYGFVEDSDLGLGISGIFPKKLGGYNLAVYNGEQRLRPEQTPHKATSLRITVNPFRNTHTFLRRLSFAGFGEYKAIDNPPGGDVDTRINWASLVFYSLNSAKFGAEWMTSHIFYNENQSPRISGIGSAFVTYQPDWYVTLFLRGDLRDPDLRQSSGHSSSRESFITGNSLPSDRDGRMYVMTGAEFALGGYIYLAPWVEGVFYQETYQGTPLAPTIRFASSLYLRF